MNFEKLSLNATTPKKCAQHPSFIMYASDQIVISSESREFVPTDIKINIPSGLVLMIYAVNTTPMDCVIDPVIIDGSYNREITVLVRNIGTRNIIIDKGMQICQFCVLPHVSIDLVDASVSAPRFVSMH